MFLPSTGERGSGGRAAGLELLSEYVCCNGKNVNENKFAAKKKLTKHKTNFSGAREKGDMLVYPLWMMAQQQHTKQEKGEEWECGKLSLHIFTRSARVLIISTDEAAGQLEQQQLRMALLKLSQGLPGGDHLVKHWPRPSPCHAFRQQNKNEQDEFTRYKKNLYLCMYEWVGVCASVCESECARGKR